MHCLSQVYSRTKSYLCPYRREKVLQCKRKKTYIFSSPVVVYLNTDIQVARQWTTVGKIALSDLLYPRRLQTSVTIFFFWWEIKLNGFKFFPDFEKIHDCFGFVGISWHFQDEWPPWLFNCHLVYFRIYLVYFIFMRNRKPYWNGSLLLATKIVSSWDMLATLFREKNSLTKCPILYLVGTGLLLKPPNSTSH